MTPKEKLDALIAQYTDLKKRLVPLERVKFERDDNIAFFHKEDIGKLKANQAITYKNVGDFMEQAFKRIDEYVRKLDGLTYAATPVSRSLSMYVNTDYVHEYPSATPSGLKLRSADIAQEDVKVVTGVDGLRLTGEPYIYSETKGRALDVTPVVYQIDAKRDAIYRITEGVAAGAEHPLMLYVVGIKINEPITAAERIVVGGEFDLVVTMSSLDVYKYEVKPFYGTGSRIFATGIHAGAIPFFSIVDIFGNDISVTGQISGRYPLSPGAPVSTERAPQKLLALTVNGKPVGLPSVDDFWLTYLGGTMAAPMQIRFDLLRKIELLNAVYFPAMAPLAQILMELADEI